MFGMIYSGSRSFLGLVGDRGHFLARRHHVTGKIATRVFRIGTGAVHRLVDFVPRVVDRIVDGLLHVCHADTVPTLPDDEAVPSAA